MSDADGAERYSWEALDKEAVLGRGSYGVVYKAVVRATGEVVALKKMDVAGCGEGLPGSTVREIGMLRKLRHKNVVRMRGVFFEIGKVFVVMEYLDKSLESLLRDVREEKDVGFEMTDDWCVGITQQILEGLEYCHHNMVLHRDIKPANVLRSPSGIIKLCDFGISRPVVIPAGQQTYTREVVTLWYRAPELLLGESSYTDRIDVWSAGCVLAELLIKTPLFKGDSEFGQLMAIFQTMGTPVPSSYPALANLPYYGNSFPKWAPLPMAALLSSSDPLIPGFVSYLLTLDPEERPSARKALEHPIFTNNLLQESWPDYS